MDLFDIAVASKLAGGGGGGGGGFEIETGTWTPSANQVTREFIPFAQTHSKLPTIVILTLTQTSADNWYDKVVTRFQYTDYYQLFGEGFNTEKGTNDGFGYSLIDTLAWVSGTNTQLFKIMTSHKSNETGDTDKTYPRYFVSENGFYATANAKYANAFFIKHDAGTWHWIAIWT